jgi:hypothetical protein
MRLPVLLGFLGSLLIGAPAQAHVLAAAQGESHSRRGETPDQHGTPGKAPKDENKNSEPQTNPVPDPSALILVGSGILVIAALTRRKHRQESGG